MPRSVKFAVEVAAALLIAAFGAWAAAKFNGKFNRSSQAAERIAAALERAYPPPKELPRPSLLMKGRCAPGGPNYDEAAYKRASKECAKVGAFSFDCECSGEDWAELPLNLVPSLNPIVKREGYPRPRPTRKPCQWRVSDEVVNTSTEMKWTKNGLSSACSQ